MQVLPAGLSQLQDHADHSWLRELSPDPQQELHEPNREKRLVSAGGCFEKHVKSSSAETDIILGVQAEFTVLCNPTSTCSCVLHYPDLRCSVSP